MSFLIAVAHLVGAIIVVGLLGLAVQIGANWELKRSEKRLLADLSLELGIPISDLDLEDPLPSVIELLSQRFSRDLFRNRLSDFCGLVRTGWLWIGSLAQLGVLLVVVWYTFTDDLGNAVYVWWVLAIQIFFVIGSVAFSEACRFITGRYPGQAESGRKILVDYIDSKPQTRIDVE